MGNIITGFMTYAVTMADITMVMAQMRQVIEEKAKREFKMLVKNQVEIIVDEIALNRASCPRDQTIFNLAKGEVLRRMLYADQKMENVEYNLSATCQFYPGKDKDGNPCTYIQMLCPNEIYSDILTKKIEGLIPFHVKRPNDYGDKKYENKKAKKWNEIMENSNGEPVLGTVMVSYNKLCFKEDELKFRTPEERAADLAQKYTLDCLVGMYATGQQIQPHKLMEFTILAMKRMQNPGIQVFERQKRDELLSILPIIDVEMITTFGGCEMKKELPATYETHDA